MCLQPSAALRLSAALLSVVFAACGIARGQSLTLTTDAVTAPYHTVVHLSASAAPAATVTFADNGLPIATLPVTGGVVVLGIATLPPGPHTLTASSAAAVSAPVSVSITPLAAPLQLAPDNATLLQHSSLNLTITGLPPRATGTLTYSDNGTPFATSPIFRSDYSAVYQAFGDSITAGANLLWPQRYPDLFAVANSFNNYNNYASSGNFACDTLTTRILPNQVGPTQDISPLYTLMIGTNDVDDLGVPSGENNFITCHRAALAWLGVPREYKVLPGDAGASILFGAWTLPPATFDSTYGTLYNSSGSGAASFSLTSNGGPLYLWYLMGDHLSGSFTVSLDGLPTGTTYTTRPATIIGSRDNPDQTGFSLIRLPVAPGPHTLRVDIASGTVGILGAATPPSPGSASAHPTIFATDIPNQNPLLALATPAMIQQYSADAFADDALLQGDGLDIRTVPTHSFLTADSSEFFDFGHPNIVGDRNLAAALQAAFGTTTIRPYLAYSESDPVKAITLDSTGTHVLTVDYSGDAIYAPNTASVSITVVGSGQSATTLTSPDTAFLFGSAIPLTAGVFPAKPGQNVILMEGQKVVATAALLSASASFSLSGLTPGLHTLYAAYPGDSGNAASVSPSLTLLVRQNTAALTLTLPAPELAYAAPLTLSAAITPAAATGTVLFTDFYTSNGQNSAQSAQTLGQTTLNGGVAPLSVATLLPGTHTFTATYSGDTDDTAATSASATILIDTISTATTLTAAPAAFGQPATFTASVSPAGVAGTVLFTDSLSATPVQAALHNGTAVWTSSTLIPGTHAITAAYAGDAIHAASTSPALAVTIDRDPVTVTLTTSSATLSKGNPVTLTAVLAPAAATGTLLFSDSVAGVLGQATLGNGVATLTLSALPAGTYSITAAYAGDTGNLPATSSVLILQVLSTATTTTLAAPASAVYAAPVTLSVNVAPVPASGLLRFFDNGALLGTTSLANGTAALTVSTLAPGTHTLTASFAGDSTHDPSTGAATLFVTPASTITTLTLAQPTVLAGSPVVVAIRVGASTDAIPAGTVTLRSGASVLGTAPLGNGSAGVAYATLSVPTSSAGTYPITASYSGDFDTTASDSSSLAFSYTVAPRIATGTLTLSATQVPPETPITLSVSFTSPATSGPALIPTGTVTFFQGTTALSTVTLDATGLATYTPPPYALGTWAFTAAYTPTGVFTAVPAAPRSLVVTPPLALAFTTSTISMVPASSADATVTFTTLSGFQGKVATQCTTPEPYLTCTVDAPSTLTGPATGKVHVTVASQTGALTLPGTRTGTIAFALLLPVSLGRRRRLRSLLTLLCAAVLTTAVTGCGEGGTFGNVPAGTFLVQLTATASNTPTSATLAVNIK